VVRYAATVALVAGAYYLTGRLGLELAYLDGAVAALWPPAGLGLAVLFLYGIRLWPGVVIGDLLLADFSTPLGTVLGQTVGNTLAVVAAALVLRRLTGGRGDLARTVDVLAFVVCALVAATVSAAFGPTSLRLGDVIAAGELGRVFRTWTLSDLSGVLVVAPALLTWATLGWRDIRRRDVVEGAIVLAVLVGIAELAPQRDVPYIVFPVLLWAALRLGPRGAATAIVVVCSVTVWNTAREDGPFVRDSITDSLLATQLFIATAALTSLLLAAVTAERTRAAKALTLSEAAQRELAGEQAALRRVATLVAAESTPSRVFRRVTEEVGRLLGLPGAVVVQYDGARYDSARTATVVGGWSEDGTLPIPVGTSLDLDRDTVVAKVLRTGGCATKRRAAASPRRCAAPATAPRWRLRSPWRAGCGARWWRPLSPTSRCRKGSSGDCATSPTSSGRRWPTPTPARGWPHRVPSWWRSATPSAGDSSATSTTALSSAWSPSPWSSAWSARSSTTIRRPPATSSPTRRTTSRGGSRSCASWRAACTRSC
jgi:integral membrane sensor domain MASE1